MANFRAVLLLLCVLVCGSYGVSPYGYHLRIGVPKYLELQQNESPLWRIIGGTQIKTPIPHQVGIIATLSTGLQSICGGSLLSNTRVVTAAHCWRDGVSQAKSFTIILGSTSIVTGGTRVPAASVVVHPRWNTADITNDIMMVKINNVAYSDNIKAIVLPATEDAKLTFAGVTGTISGYGKTTDGKPDAATTNTLFQTTVTIITNADCQKLFDNDNNNNIKLQASHLCTSGARGNVKVGTCEGDSGGPLTAMVKDKLTLVGIVSFGKDTCTSGDPSAYTRVTDFLPWITSNMK